MRMAFCCNNWGLMGTNCFGLYRSSLWPTQGKKNESP